MALNLPPLPAGQPIVDPKTGNPAIAFSVYWQQLLEALAEAINTIETTLTDVIDLNDLITSANVAIAAADAAATAAQVAADTAQGAADDVTAAQALGTSFVSGATIGATDAGVNATITISAHTRHYPQPDGSTVDVAVAGGSLTGRAYSTLYYVYYDDPARTGGAVTYASTTSESTAAQIGARHVVGNVTTPAALGAATGGAYVRPPGSGAISKL